MNELSIDIQEYIWASTNLTKVEKLNNTKENKTMTAKMYIWTNLSRS